MRRTARVEARDPDMERWVAEIRLRARRRVGELSAALDTAQGARSELLPAAGKKSDALAAAGLSTSEAHRCEQIAKVPASAFETYIATQTAAGQVTTAGLLRASVETLEQAVAVMRAR